MNGNGLAAGRPLRALVIDLILSPVKWLHVAIVAAGIAEISSPDAENKSITFQN